MRRVQILIYTSQHCLDVSIRLGELTRRHFADVLYVVDVTRSKSECDNGCSH